MKLSYVIVTRNRCQTLLQTLAHLETATGLPRHQWEVFVIDNASDDDTVAAVSHAHRDAQVIRLPENEGVPARNHALPRIAGKYVVFLDDDSYPTGDAIPKALKHLGRYPKTAAVVARVILPDGSAEAPAFPAVTLGGASIVRASVLKEVGGFAPEFFRQAEEYEMSLRIWGAGYRIERFEDILFGHDKVPGGRCSALAHRMDLRNNLILVERYLPRHLRRAYRHDFIRRYAALAMADGHADAVNAALLEARVWARREAAVGRETLKADAIEQVFDLERQAAIVAEWVKRLGLKRVAIADMSKNLYATFQACRRANVAIDCVADSRRAFAGQKYRGVPILPDAEACARGVDGVILSTVNPAQVDRRFAELESTFRVPVLRLWHPRWLVAPEGATPTKPPESGNITAVRNVA